jgi:phage terminase small subunit
MCRGIVERNIKKVSREKLNKRERLFLKYLADPNCKSQQEAAIRAGYSKRSAHSIATEILRKPAIQETYCAILEKAGLSDEYIAGKHKEIVDATKPVSLMHADDPTRQTTIDIPDHMSRAKGIDMYYKVRGKYVEKKEITGPGGGPIKIESLSNEQLLRIIQTGSIEGIVPETKGKR